MARPVYQDGRLLRTADYVDEQGYQISELRRHERTHHSWGIASGLDIVLTDGQLTVQPGVAIDGYGRVVELRSTQALDVRRFALGGTNDIDVWLQYAVQTTNGVDEYLGRIGDSAVVELRSAGEIIAPTISPPDAVASVVAESLDDVRPAWMILLGRITLHLQKPEEPPDIDLSGRRYIGLVGSTISTHNDPNPWITLAAGTVYVGQAASESDPAPLTVSGTEVKVHGTLDVQGTLTLQGGSLIIGTDPAPNAGGAAKDWSISQATAGVANELRISFPNQPSRVVIGVWDKGKFLPRVTVDEKGTMTVVGNLHVNGAVIAQSILEPPLSPAAQAYVDGLKSLGLTSLYTVPPGTN